MTRVERREFENLSQLGPIDLASRSDPVAQELFSVGITSQDLKSIGNGDMVLRGDAELSALYDRLRALDKKDPSGKSDRADRISRLLRATRTGVVEPPPPAPSFNELSNSAAFRRGSAEIQAGPALRALDKAEQPTQVPKDIREAAADAANPALDPKLRDDARARVGLWLEVEATRVAHVRSDLIGQRNHLERLIGSQDGNGTRKSGYYEQVIAAAQQARRQHLVRAQAGDANSIAIVARSDRSLIWAQRELAEARVAFQRLIAGESRLRGVLGDGALVLAELSSTHQKTSTALSRADGHISAYAQLLKSADAEHKAPDAQEGRSLLLKAYGELDERIQSTGALIQKLEAGDVDAPMKEWLETSGAVQLLETERAGLISQQAEIEKALAAQHAQPIAKRAEQAFGLQQVVNAASNEAVMALGHEGDTALDARAQGLRDLRANLKTAIVTRKEELTQLKTRIAQLQKLPALTLDQAFELKEARSALRGEAMAKDGTAISLEEEIKALEGAYRTAGAAIESVQNRRSELAQALGAIGKAYNVKLEIKGNNAGLIDAIQKLEQLSHVDGLVQKDKSLELTIQYKDKRSETLRLGPNSSYPEVRRFALAYEWRQRQQLATGYEVLRQVTAHMAKLSDKDMVALGLDKLDPKTAGKPDYIEKRLPQLFELYGRLMGKTLDAAGEKALIEWAQAPDKKGAFPKPVVRDAEMSGEGIDGAYRFLLARGGEYGSPRQAMLAALADPDLVRGVLVKSYDSPDPVKGFQGHTDKAIAFMRLALLDPRMSERLGLDLKLEPAALHSRFVRWMDEYKLIAEHQQRPTAKRTGEDVEQRSVAPVEPAFFMDAEARVGKLAPGYGWGLKLFDQVKDLSRERRAYVVVLFDAKFTKKADQADGRSDKRKAETPTALGTQLGYSRPGDAAIALHFIEGETSIERQKDFKSWYGTKPEGISHFLKIHRGRLQEFKNANVEMPKAELEFFERRIGEVENLAKELPGQRTFLADLKANRQTQVDAKMNTSEIDQRIGEVQSQINAAETKIVQLGADALVLRTGLDKAWDAEIKFHNIAVDHFRKFWKNMGVAAAAMAAAYLTAGALAPEAGLAGAALVGTLAGTAAGMSVSFVWDVGEQAADKGVSNVSGWHALDSAIDDFPTALTSAMPTAFVTASMTRFGLLANAAVNDARAIQIMGMTVKPAQIAQKAKMAGELAVYSGASTYVSQVIAGGYVMARAKNDAERVAGKKMIDGAGTEGVFAAISAPLLMPFSRYNGVAGRVADMGTNAVQKLAYNAILGRDLDEGLMDAVIMGGVAGKMFESIRNVQAARKINASGGVGSKVKLPGERGEAGWTLKSVQTKRGFVVLEGGYPPRTMRMSAEVIVMANPHLHPPPSKVEAKTWIGASKAAPKIEPSTLSENTRAVATQLEQRLRRTALPAVKDATGNAAEVTVHAHENANGSVELRATIHERGSDAALAELRLHIDPKSKTVKVTGLAVASELSNPTIARRIFGAQADMLRRNFAGWKVEIESPTGAGRSHNNELRGMLEHHFDKVQAPSRKNKAFSAEITTPQIMFKRVAPTKGWDRVSALGVDRNRASITVEKGNGHEQVPVREAIEKHPELVRGMAVEHNGARYRVGSKNRKNEFELIPMDPQATGSRPRITADELFQRNPGQIEELLLPPPARIRVIEQGATGPVWKDRSNYRVVGVDPATDTVFLRNSKNEIEIWAADRVAYEHSGVALGSLGVAQHANYEKRLLGLTDELSTWAHLQADAADISSEHLTMVQRSFAAGHSLAAIRGLLDSVAKVPRAELGALFSPRDMPQHFTTSCVPAACLAGLATVDPLLAKFLKDHPDVLAAMQRVALEDGGGKAVTRMRDHQYGRYGEVVEQPGSKATPSQVVGDRSFYDAPQLDANLTLHTFNQPGFWKNKNVIVGYGDAPRSYVRLHGDEKGRVFVESPAGSGKSTLVKGDLFRVRGNTLEYHGGGKVPELVRELGVPNDVTLVSTEAARGMNAGNSNFLKSIYELRTGQSYSEVSAKHLSLEEFRDAVDLSLSADLPVGYAVNWFDLHNRPVPNSGHQLAIVQRREGANGQHEYLVLEPHDDRPVTVENGKWLTIDQVYEYRRFGHAIGRPQALFVPDFVPVPEAATPVPAVPHNAPTGAPTTTRQGPPPSDPHPRAPKVPFVSEGEARYQNFSDEFMAGGKGRSQADAKALFDIADGYHRDPVTQLSPAEDFPPTLDRVIEGVKNGDPAIVMRASFRNLAGVNKQLGHTDADAVFQAYAKVVNDEVAKIPGARVAGFRNGPDMSFVIQGDLPNAAIEMVFAKARIEARAVAEKHKLTWLPHPKHENNNFRGSDLTLSSTRVNPTDSSESIPLALGEKAQAREAQVGRPEPKKTDAGPTIRTRDVPAPADVPAPQPTKRDKGATPFKTERQVIWERFQARAKAAKLSDLETHNLWAKTGANKADEVTGYARAEDRRPTMERAIQHISDHPTESAFYVEMDIRNLGTLTKTVGRAKADGDFRVAADLIKQELNAIGADVSLTRHGADEVSAVIVGPKVEQAAIEAALGRAQARFQKYVVERGLADLPHPKFPGDAKRNGVGFTFAVEPAFKGDTADGVFGRADREVEKRKANGSQLP